MTRSFDIEVTTRRDELVARVAGEIDMLSRAELTDRVTIPLFDRPGITRVVLDMAGVEFCDSSGLGALLDIRRAAGGAGIDVVLRHVPLPLARLLDLAEVDGWFRQE